MKAATLIDFVSAAGFGPPLNLAALHLYIDVSCGWSLDLGSLRRTPPEGATYPQAPEKIANFGLFTV
jgi:hypothetical protein